MRLKRSVQSYIVLTSAQQASLSVSQIAGTFPSHYAKVLLNEKANSNTAAAEALCQSCGLCCNGVIFARGQLQEADDAEKLRDLGLRIARSRKSVGAGPACAVRFAQPCTAYEGGLCRIYAERPLHCRNFECLLLQRVEANDIDHAAALRTIRETRMRVDKVKNLLRALGNSDEQTNLQARFRRTVRDLQAGDPPAVQAHLFGELTLAMHDLNLALSQSFYPQP